MLYLIGGAARVGKTTLCHQVSISLNIGWISTDLLMTLLGMTKVEGFKTEWNAAPEALATSAEWFYPYLERFVWGIRSFANDYVIEGVDFLPAQLFPIGTAPNAAVTSRAAWRFISNYQFT